MTNEQNIYQRLSEVQRKVRYIQKEDKIVNNQYRFVSHDAVTAAATEAFLEFRILAIPQIISTELSTIEVERYDKHLKANKKEVNFICKVEVSYEFVNIDKPEERVVSSGFVGQGIDSQDKACGKAISYACKYALLKVLGIETGDDPEKDVDFSLTKKDSLNTKLAKIADEDMKQTQQQANKEVAKRLIKKIEGMGSVAELQAWLEDKAVVKAYNQLEKYANELYQEVRKADIKKTFELDPENNEAK